MAQRTYPQGGTTGTQILGYVGDITLELPRRAPQPGLHPGQPGRRSRDRGPVRALPARGRRAPGPLRGRQRHGRRHPQHDGAPDRRHGGAQHRHRPPAGGRAGPRSSRSWPTATPSTARRRRYPPAPNGAAIVMNPQNGQVLALASYPTYDLNEWVGGISHGQLHRAAGQWRREQLRHRGPVHARVDLQARHGDGGAAGRHLDAGAVLRRHRAPSRSRAARPRECNNDTGLRPARRPGRQRRDLQHLGRADRVERLVLLQPGRPVLARPWHVRRHADPERGHRLRRGDDHRHRPAGRGAGPGRQPDRPGQAARGGAQGVPQRRLVVHRRQHRDGLRPGRDRAHARSSRRSRTRRSPTAAPATRPGRVRDRRPR